MITALITFTPFKRTSASKEEKSPPFDLGDLLLVAMDNLRLSISGDDMPIDEQLADFVSSVHAQNAKHSHSTSNSTPSPFAMTSSSTATPGMNEMSAFYESPHKDPLLPSATISEAHTHISPSTQHESSSPNTQQGPSSPSTQQDSPSPSIFLPASYGNGKQLDPCLSDAAASVLHESLRVRGPDGSMDFAMSYGDSLFETLFECMQSGDIAPVGLPTQPNLSQPPQPHTAVGTAVDPDIDFSSWLAGELQGDAPWAMPSGQSPLSPG